MSDRLIEGLRCHPASIPPTLGSSTETVAKGVGGKGGNRIADRFRAWTESSTFPQTPDTALLATEHQFWLQHSVRGKRGTRKGKTDRLPTPTPVPYIGISNLVPNNRTETCDQNRARGLAFDSTDARGAMTDAYL